MAKVIERARQIWPILAWAASRRQTITYEELATIVGTIARDISRYLQPIQAYCLRNHLPPLTVIVVGKDTGEPGERFAGCPRDQIPLKTLDVFRYAWLRLRPPIPDDL